MLEIAGIEVGQGVVHFLVGAGALLAVGSYAITAGGYAHFFTYSGSFIRRLPGTAVITLTNNPSFTYFAYASRAGMLDINASTHTFSGFDSGTRYYAETYAILYCPTSGPDYLPGTNPGFHHQRRLVCGLMPSVVKKLQPCSRGMITEE